MAEEIKDLETLTDPAATEAGENENSVEAPAEEEATQHPFALGENASAGDTDSAPTDAPAESDPTSEAPVADADLGTYDSLTPAAEDSSEAPAEDSTPAGDAAPVDQAPAATGTPAAADVPNDAGASDAAFPEADASAEDLPTTTSTGIGGDKASEVEPAEEPKLEPEAAPAPAAGMFNTGTPIKLPAMTVDVSEGYPVAQPDVAPAHPQHFATLLNDGVGEDAGKAADEPKYPAVDAPEVVDGGKGAESQPSAFADKAAEPAEDGSDAVPVAEPAIPAAFEGRFRQLTDKLGAIEAKLSQLVHELLD